MQELVAGWIVERKTFSDLGSSIRDGRFEDLESKDDFDGFCGWFEWGLWRMLRAGLGFSCAESAKLLAASC